MDYKVVLMRNAENDPDSSISYILVEKKSKQVPFFRIIIDILFRYFNKYYSDIVDIIPLKRYTIS